MKRALLVIDVQNEYFNGKLPIKYPNDSFQNIKKAIDATNDNNIDVILIQHTAPQVNALTFRKGSSEWEIHSEILERRHTAIVEKNLPGSFTGTNLENMLKDNDIDTITICGYMTQMCCDTTARQAFHIGLKVEFLSDATGTLDISNVAGTVTAEQMHQAILVAQQAKFSTVLTTDEWISHLRL